MNRAQRRAAGHARPRPAGDLGTLDGVPVFDGSLVEVVRVDLGSGPDARVMLGVGPAGGRPVAYLALCPCDGVSGLVSALIEGATDATPHHEAHRSSAGPEWPADRPF